MTEALNQCAHHACTCTAQQGDYCSDYCREHAGTDDITCGCGHAQCAGTAEELEAATG